MPYSPPPSGDEWEPSSYREVRGAMLWALVEEGRELIASHDPMQPVVGSPVAKELDAEQSLGHAGLGSRPILRAVYDLKARCVVFQEQVAAVALLLADEEPHPFSVFALARSAVETAGLLVWLIGPPARHGDAEMRLARWIAELLDATQQSRSQVQFHGVEVKQLERFRAGLPPSHRPRIPNYSSLFSLAMRLDPEMTSERAAAEMYRFVSAVAHGQRFALAAFFEHEGPDADRYGPTHSFTMPDEAVERVTELLALAHNSVVEHFDHLFSHPNRPQSPGWLERQSYVRHACEIHKIVRGIGPQVHW